MKSIMAVVAHPDDEALGGGGTLARHADRGDDIRIIFVADGVGSRDEAGDTEKQKRYDAARQAAEALGINSDHVSFLSFADNQLDRYPLLDVVQAIEHSVEDFAPNIVYTHHHGDLNIDHEIVHRATLTAFRPMPGSQVEAIYGMEILSSTEWNAPTSQNAFIPAHYVDIDGYLNHKQKALAAYDMEMRNFPHSRSYRAVEAQATLRGAQVGLKASETFTILRQIEKQR